MKKLISYSLFLIFTSVQIYNTCTWIWYEVNTEEITNLFCENTDFPELNCNGKCHLKKQLINHSTPESTPVSELNYLPLIDLFFNDLPAGEPSSEKHSPLNQFSYSAHHGVSLPKKIFQPPRV